MQPAMTARELCAWLRALHPVPEPSVDRVIAGHADTEVRGVAVMWMPTWTAGYGANRIPVTMPRCG